MPRKAKELSPLEVQQTFAEGATPYIDQHTAAWKNEKHAAQWTATLRTYAEPVLGQLLVRDVTSAHVVKVLEPIWRTKTETATRVRSRIELVLDFAAARGLREGPNPARWRGNLDAAFPQPTAYRCASQTHNTGQKCKKNHRAPGRNTTLDWVSR